MAHVGKDDQLCTRNGGRKIIRVSASNEFFMVAIGDDSLRHFDSGEFWWPCIGAVSSASFRVLGEEC